MTLRATTWQTVGPFFKIGLAWLYRDNLAGADVPGEHIEITGRVLDGDGKTVPDAVLELWQANSHGKYAHPEDEQNKQLDAGFSGFGRIATDDQGRFHFTTIKPGQVPAPAKSGQSERRIGAASAAHQCFRLHPRSSAPSRHADLFSRRARKRHRFRAFASRSPTPLDSDSKTLRSVAVKIRVGHRVTGPQRNRFLRHLVLLVLSVPGNSSFISTFPQATTKILRRRTFLLKIILTFGSP